MQVDPGRFPLLATPQDVVWTSGPMRFAFEPVPPEAALIGNVRCAAFLGEQVILIDTEEFGLSAFPGGTLEPGESWEQTLSRELMEEAGASPLSVEVMGRLTFRSGGADGPYRPHLPFPEFHQVVAGGRGRRRRPRAGAVQP